MVKKSAYPATVQSGKPLLGELPSGWRRIPLGEHLVEMKRSVKLEADVEYDLVTVKRARGGVARREHLLGKNIAVQSQFKIEAGDFLISKRQIVHGACGIVPPELDGSIVSNEYSVLCSDGHICLEFLKYLSHSIYFQQTCFHSSIGVHVEKMIFKIDQWLKFPFNIPPLPEQKKIAQILSTWDKAITTTEQLLANSRQQKKALMQQLLTGKNRYPGFSGEWNDHYLTDVAKVIVSPVDKKTVDGEISVRLCNYTDVYYNTHITRNLKFMEATAKQAEIDRFALKIGDVVITKDSETPGDIAVPALISEDLGGVVCGYHLAIVRPKRSVLDSAFLNYLFSMQKTRYYFFTLATGATRFGLSIGGINKAHFKLPPIKEQRRIASALSISDQEVEVLKQKLDFLKREKKSLIQQLLTGKRRVNVEREARNG
ncbi:restriction endonuclease subunit S [Microbulbifer sp.]|uniref:restriction endonuclease subunit S n=1 Tax=Microbulbifer sp. TaxID=1908541 RepID=UPI003F2BEB21